MAEPDNNERIQKYIKDLINPDAQRGLKLYQETAPKFDAAIKDLKDALDNADADLIGLYHGSLEEETKKAETALLWLDQAFDNLRSLTKNSGGADLAADFPELKTLAKSMSSAKTRLVALLKTGSDLEGRATKALANEAGNERDAVAKWGRLVASERMAGDRAKKELDYIQGILAKAKAAVKARDTKLFKQMQKESLYGVNYIHDQGSLDRLQAFFIANFAKEFKVKNMSKEFQAQVARETASLVSLSKQVEAWANQTEAAHRELSSLVIEPPDAAKAAKVLGFPTTAIPKLKKALELDSPAMLKSLEALAKELHLDLTAKDMVSKLTKANIL